jgi:hypothetical protein
VVDINVAGALVWQTGALIAVYLDFYLRFRLFLEPIELDAEDVLLVSGKQ